MGRCGCVLASGPDKGSQCSYQTKLGSKFCGIHKTCKKTVSQVRDSQSAHEPESTDVCPDRLRPVDGQCPPKFPDQRRLPDGSLCCMTNLRRIRKLKQQKVSQPSADLESAPCQLGNLLNYYPPDELGPRQINITGSDCQAYNRALLMEFPSLDWIEEQRLYLKKLDPFDRTLLKFYTYHGDVILNNFARHQWSITENDMDYLRVKYMHPFDDILESLMTTLHLTESDSVEQLLLVIYNRVNQLIMGSPINPHRFVSYRGSLTKDYYEHSQKQIFQNVGFFSTSLLISRARSFSQGKFMSRIIVPEGYHCLYLEPITASYGEHEILMPDRTQYYISSGFHEQIYLTFSIPTNELVMVKTRPQLLTNSQLLTHHPIKDLIRDRKVRQQIGTRFDILKSVSGVYIDIHQYQKVWLHHLSDHQIYTLDDFLVRGLKLEPTLAEVNPIYAIPPSKKS